MANEKLTQQTELTTPAADDLVYIVDVSDTTDGAAGSSRKIQVSNLMKEAPVQPSDLTGYATTTYVDTEVGNEESARITADANLQTNIDAVNTAVSSLTTDDVTEATNLYHTSARVDARIAAASVTDLSDVTSAGSGAIITAAERTQISTNQTNIGINAGGIATNASNITALDAQVQTNSTDIGTLNSDLTAIDTRVSAAETDIAGLQTDLDALNLTDLNDTPATLGTAGQLLAVNATATATEWVDPATGGGDVTSVNGQTGVVVLDTDDVSEGTTNLYHTSARVDARIAAKIADTTLVSTINGESGDATGDVSLSTTEIPEGSNLYYTDARVQTYLTSEKIRANYPSLFYTGNTLITSQQEQTLMIGKASATMQFAVSAGLSKDCEILVMQDDVGSIIITGAQGVTILTSSSFKPETAGQYAIIGLKQIGLTNTYVVTGERKPV